MNTRTLSALLLPAALCGCALTHYKSLDQAPDTDIVITARVAVELWENGERIAPAAKEHTLKNAEMRRLTLKREGYHDLDMIVWRNQPEKRNVTSHDSSVSWTGGQVSDISADLSETGADAATTSPTSTVMLPVNLVKTVLRIVWVPFDFTTEYNPLGYYYTYGKNQFRADMRPASKPFSPQDAYNAQVEEFVLKNYPPLAGRDAGYLAALAQFSGITVADIEKLLDKHHSPESMADAVIDKMSTVHGN